MEIRLIEGALTELDVGAVVVNVYEGVKQPIGPTETLDLGMEGYITHLIESGEISGRRGEITLIHSQGKILPERVIVVGLGKQESVNIDTIRGISAEVARFLRRKGIRTAATVVHGADIGGLMADETSQAMTEGTLLGLYRFLPHSKNNREDEGKELDELFLVKSETGLRTEMEDAIARGRILAEATALARDLVNEPANYMTPTILAQRAQAIAESSGLEFTCLEQAQMKDLGMGALLGVARGSHEPPKFIILEYKGNPDSPENTLGLLGKGVTFDSGGISIKPAAGMGAMKGDMAGGAATIAAMQAIANLKPKINVTGLVPATENLPGGGAIKPGDVLLAMSKKSIEVENTDAEGRLILADALSYARARGLEPLVDIATLTGAIRVALGTVSMGLFANDDSLANRILEAGAKAGERVWRMPLWDEYKEQNKSDVADVKNSGGRDAGSITAAQFLHEFAEDTPWAHLDIAGVSMKERDKAWEVKGATGQPVRTVVNLILDIAGNMA